MHNSKSDKERPTAREQALARRVFDMREVLGMRYMPPFVILQTDKKEVVPPSASETWLFLGLSSLLHHGRQPCHPM
jgi:hypothetical protein